MKSEENSQIKFLGQLIFIRKGLFMQYERVNIFFLSNCRLHAYQKTQTFT
jgi:hypothetical protein